MMPLTIGGTTQLGAQTPFLAGVSTVVQVPSSQVNENLIPEDDPREWLHRNDNYFPNRLKRNLATISDHCRNTNDPSTIRTLPSEGELLPRFHP